MTDSKFLHELPQYHFDRHDFVATLSKIFPNDELFDLEMSCINHTSFPNFLLYHDTFDEFYIIHLKSGTIINWYKHLGRTNTCNKEGFTLNDLQDLLELLKEDMRGSTK